MFHTLRPRACDETASFCKHSHPSPLVSVTQDFFKICGFLISQQGDWLVGWTVHPPVLIVATYMLKSWDPSREKSANQEATFFLSKSIQKMYNIYLPFIQPLPFFLSLWLYIRLGTERLKLGIINNLFYVYPTKYMKQETQNLQWIARVLYSTTP